MITASTFFESGGAKLPVGIHMGVTFEGLETADTHIDVNFSKDGQTAHKRIFAPAGKYPRDGESQVAALEREVKDRIKELVYIGRTLIGDKVLEGVSAADEDALLQKLILILNREKGKKVNLKMVPNKKEPKYSDIPRYLGYLETFIEDQETKLKFTEKEQDLINQSKPATKPGMDASGLV